MPVEDAPADDDVRQSYNFAPGYHGLVYRADGSDHGGQQDDSDDTTNVTPIEHEKQQGVLSDDTNTKYKLQSMQWGN
jgi:hypothetical protein